VLPLAVMPGVDGGAGQTYVVLARPPGSMALGRFVCTLRFRVKEIDPSTGGRRWGQGGRRWLSVGPLVDLQQALPACFAHDALTRLSCLPPGRRRGGGGGLR
jgi:hypothetical protein